ncbi:MAG: cytochrome c3 family protein [Sedimentisphaerales bacterium]|nr:cytochrome c3 family protein [Sedimentisphaerales bacterium]
MVLKKLQTDRTAKTFASIVAFVFMVTITERGWSEDIPLHHFELACDTCHSVGVSNRGEVGEFKSDISQLCSQSSCHNLDSVLSHPVGVRPTGTIRQGMPLDQDSRVTCLTCHITSLSSKKDKMLHVPNEEGFCAKCHLKMSGNARQRSHWQFSTSAHLGPISPNKRYSSNFATVGDIDVDIDKESHSCLSCHDNSISASIQTVSWSNSARRESMSDHPIGMSYQEVSMQRVNRYFPLANTPQIRLFDGRLGCGSCHSLYSQQQKKLVMSNQNDRLCVRCHNK